MTIQQSDQEQIEFLNRLMTSKDNIIDEKYYKLSDSEKKTCVATILRYNNCEVKFKKVDGSIRTMPCTLQPAQLPVQLIKEDMKTTKTKKENPANLAVFCLDKKEWRSFKLDNLLWIKII